MKFRISLLIYFISLYVYGVSQTPPIFGEITDVRDGQIYQTITIDKTIWLAENMRYKTENSMLYSENSVGVKIGSHYYPFDEAEGVCPEGFQIPKESDWEKYVEYVMELKNVQTASIEKFDTKSKRVTGTGIEDSSDKIQFFSEPNPLNLEQSGIIQGDEMLYDKALSFWTRKGESKDHKYHLHIYSDGYGNHTHKHHIDSKEKKKRKFVVRCVSNKNSVE